MLRSERYGKLYLKTIAERSNVGVRLQGVKPDILMLDEPSEEETKTERERRVVEYRNKVRNGDVCEATIFICSRRKRRLPG